MENNLKNTNLNFIPLEKDQYPNYINTFPENYFDLILIDGRNRIQCIKNSISKLKVKGLLVLDNSEREKYKEGIELLQNWKEIKTSNGMWSTTIWVKI